MPDTTSVPIDNAGWTKVSGTLTAGFLSLGTGGSILCRQSALEPAVTVTDGHVLNPPSDSINFDLPMNDFVWARSENVKGLVFITGSSS